ncbi:pyridoxal-phosphate dependent enzyme [Virgibacillus salexigens]|uniref:pyridoxal-phosphate dependent enzyme n=1 Tax=Virgibacillus massiliensis TaxID=1462526 RepID=UPI00136CB786|nr:pyridoxal-phosphate dependent enzyme [Virgibacillus massiliensis]MYL43180.1 pyridoxal-phosphate dependent enzyme [Virgibacillus massiliensis]
MESVLLREIWQARKRISAITQPTPLIYSENLSALTNKSVHFKMENWNTTHSFKIRGAANKILSLSPEQRSRGITTFSTGNFGISVGYVAKQLGIKAVICISNRVPQAKVNVLEATGAEIKVIGSSQDDAERYSRELEQKHGLSVIHPFDDPKVIAGYGTMGLEILYDLPEVDTVLAGLSGGGLHSGLGVTLKTMHPDLRLIGLSTARGATMYESLQAGYPIELQEKDTLADSLLGGIGKNNQYTFSLVQAYVDEIKVLDEQLFADGMTYMLDKHRVIIEGAAASGIGAILHQQVHLGNHVVIVISGSSVDTSTILKLMKDKFG